MAVFKTLKLEQLIFEKCHIILHLTQNYTACHGRLKVNNSLDSLCSFHLIFIITTSVSQGSVFRTFLVFVSYINDIETMASSVIMKAQMALKENQNIV